MSDNRMWLVNSLTGQRTLLAKHNHGAWFRQHDDLNDRLDALFEAEVEEFYTSWGTTGWQLEYERDESIRHDFIKRNVEELKHG